MPSISEASQLPGTDDGMDMFIGGYDDNDDDDDDNNDDNDNDGESVPSVAHTTTPLTTAHSTTASRKFFPSDLKTIPCTWPNCGKTFNRPARLTAHLRSHTNDRPFKCAVCAKAYLEEKHLRQHIKGSHTQERRYVCDQCGKAFLTATRLRRHAAVHAGEDRFRCRGYDPACTRTFRKHQTLQRHIRVDHLGQPAFVCSHAVEPTAGAAASVTTTTTSTTCGAVFDSAGALRRHAEREHGRPKYWCEECSTAAPTDNDNSNDKTPRPVGFATRALLEAHMRRAHVTCLFCDARCAGPAELHRHIDMHHAGKTVSDRKTIVCPYAGCGKTFTRRPNLNVHIRAAHEGLRFVCGDAAALGGGGGGGGVEADAPPGKGVHDASTGNTNNNRNPALTAWDARTEGCGRGFVSKMKLEEHILYVHLRRARPPPPATVVAPTTTTLSTAAGPASSAWTTTAEMFIDVLAGTNRTLACTHTGCAARFVRHHDLQVHIQRAHGGAASAAAAAPSPSGNAQVVPPTGSPFAKAQEAALDPVLSRAGSEGVSKGAGDTNNGIDIDIGGDGDGDGNTMDGAAFWIGADGSNDDALHGFRDADDMFGAYMSMNLGGLGADLGFPAAINDGDGDDDDDDEAEWQVDEAETRRLIGSNDDENAGADGDGSGRADCLDPNLFA
ncbi:c2h2 transcription factor [Niveomyces insectorum RCEF 264]|uniref:C2h2 transcription factor n=1 Tax=Niveomyces insectorum RCEF 264 TaxID=1081102 RepID=A0A167RHQ1_9HYPO|nr:c2h2 transcription factor [Niveomyces insectorum RCEF 264]